MRLFTKPFEVTEDEGFSKNDIFGRKKIADGLTNLVSKVEDPLVIALDGDWGSGKTVFLKMWQGELKTHGFPVIYFDAFANDYFEDAFIPLAAEVVNLAKSKLKDRNGKLAEFTLKAKTAGKVILRGSAKVAVKLATLGAIEAKDVEGIVADETTELFDKHVGELITKHGAAKSDIEAFRTALQELPALLAESEEDKEKPLIVIVDELDRCRPTYALQLLERMKHFFSVPNVHFVLGTNVAQLSMSVVAAYGAKLDGWTYLQKFIQLTVQLLDTHESHFNTTPSKFLSYLLNGSSLQGKDLELVSECNEELSRIAEATELSLRQIEQAYAHVLRATATTKPTQFRNSALIAGLSVLKVVAPEQFLDAKQGRLLYSSVTKTLGFLDRDDPMYKRAGSNNEQILRKQFWGEAWWRFVSDLNCPQEMYDSCKNALFSFSSRNPSHILQSCANNQIDNFVSSS